MKKYDDIINMSKPKSKYQPMSLASRAMQFAPFSALTGHKETLEKVKKASEEKYK